MPDWLVTAVAVAAAATVVVVLFQFITRRIKRRAAEVRVWHADDRPEEHEIDERYYGEKRSVDMKMPADVAAALERVLVATEERLGRELTNEERELIFRQLPELEMTKAERPVEHGDDRRNVQFHALWEAMVEPEAWTTLFVYMWAGREGYLGARDDFERRARLPVDEYEAGGASAALERGASITIVPHLPGSTFNPPFAEVLWLEEWQRVEFRMRVSAGAETSPPRNGAITFYVGPLMIAEIALQVVLGDRSHLTWELREEMSQPYRAIFVSYAHEDTPIVEGLERAYRALGDSYLRDVNILRSGERWSEALLNRIPDADVFQLCWSTAAQQSVYVEQEWRFANELRRPHFIRPVYWAHPMPPPPSELADIHFAFVPLKS